MGLPFRANLMKLTKSFNHMSKEHIFYTVGNLHEQNRWFRILNLV